MDEVEKCSDVAALSDGDMCLTDTTSGHTFTHTESGERIFCYLRGVEAMGGF